MSEVTPINIRVEYSIEATVNIGDFQNVRPGFTLSADVPEGASPTAVKNRLKQTADAWLDQRIAEIKEELNG